MGEGKKGFPTRSERIAMLEAQIAGVDEDLPGAALEDMTEELIEERAQLEASLAELKGVKQNG